MPTRTSQTRPVPVAANNTATPPICEEDCAYRLRYDDLSLQTNALRTEVHHMVEEWRCGWNLKEGVVGGRPLDYAPCICPPNGC